MAGVSHRKGRRSGEAVVGALALTLATLAPLSAQQGGAPGRPQKPPMTLQQVGEKLEKEGLKGRVHGSSSRLGTYVFTWWEPGSFFRSFNLSLLPSSKEVADQLATLERHQAVTVHGRFSRSSDSQPHLIATAIEPGARWEPGVQATLPPRKFRDVEKDLRKKDKIRALVHTSSDDGGMLVIEYRDQVVPVQVPPDADLRKQVGSLFRGDRIQIRYKVAPYPERPMHLLLVSKDPKKPALVVEDALHDLHDKDMTIEGNLVMFPNSPVLQRTIYGIEVKGKEGLDRYLTVFNFEDVKDQDKTDAMLKSAWAAHSEGIRDGRNKYINTRVKVRASGKLSNPARNQANATLVTSSDRVHIVERSH